MLICVVLLSYCLGAIPSAYLVVKLSKNYDIRNYGSGNVGATNTARVLGIRGGLFVLFLDLLKGFLAVSIFEFSHFFHLDLNLEIVVIISGLAVIIGHNWSIFLKFKGGKGVATTLGVMLRFMPLTVLVFVLIWLITFILLRFVSLSSILGAITYPISTYFFYKNNLLVLFSLILMILIIYRHRSNINRLLNGQENKFQIY